MSSGASGSDEQISGAKIEPLASEAKAGVPLNQSSRGVVGTDKTIDQSRIELVGGHGQFQHPLPHADDQGVIGTDESVGGAKIAPLGSNEGRQASSVGGLGDELVAASRIQPLGEVREELS